MNKLDLLAMEMIAYNKEDARRSQHLLKVRTLCHLIAIGENMPEDDRYTLETAALVHDIGIRAAEQKFGMQNGKLQEELGPPIAREMLTRLGFSEAVTERACWLIAHHHTYSGVEESLDYRILLEADWLVNNFEFQLDRRTIYASHDRIFRTVTGKKIFKDMFGDM